MNIRPAKSIDGMCCRREKTGLMADHKLYDRVTEYKEDLCRFDFEVDAEDEYMCAFESMAKSLGFSTPSENGDSAVP